MKQRIGFVGLGAMGKPMATRLMRAGYEVIISAHRNRVVVDELVQQGARLVDHSSAMATQTDVVITMLPDAPQVEEVCLGTHGLTNGKESGSALTVIDMSTISPLATRAIADRLQEAGIAMLDAPVSGGPWRAETGELTIMVGGDEELLELHRAILSVLGTTIVHVGPSGHGEIVKMANNMIAGMLMPVLSEALTLGVKAGVDLATLHKVICMSSGRNYMLEQWLPKTLFREQFEDGFALELLRKDLGIALEMGRELDVPLHEAGLAYQLFTQAKGLGYGREDFSAVSKIYQQAANINIVTGEPVRS